jgi:hypothetical protein
VTPTHSSKPGAVIAWLRTPAAIRERCERIFAAAEADRLVHFALEPERLEASADYVLDTIRSNYPDLAIPYHSRWRHFAVGGHDRWREFAAAHPVAAHEQARRRVELAIVSVLLDAGAGERWRYRDPDSGEYHSRSEGLALASFQMYRQGLFSSRADTPRVDAEALSAMTSRQLAQAFQVSDDNPLVGLDGRVELLRRLGAVLQTTSTPGCFGSDARLGCLADYLIQQADDHRLAAADVLTTLLDSLSAIWPGRIEIAGVNLGDVWRHPAIHSADASDGLIPFHKLSQWLSYSLLEPLQEVGIEITDVDALTGLPEYRNGGLFIDLGVLRPKYDELFRTVHAVGSEVVVEWRALTVCLLDRLAGRIRARLGLDQHQLPLAKVLEGGSWSAGRRIARELRADGTPPLRLDSDGTVF